MTKDKRCAETGGWYFDFFVGDATTTGLNAEGQKACYTCHTKAPGDLVYSKFRRP